MAERTNKTDEMRLLRDCAAAVRCRTDFTPRVALVLGSGLGGFADELRKTAEIPYEELPGFPRSTAPGHAGRLVLGYVEDVPVAVLQGRVHLYEGYSPAEVVRPVRLLAMLGAKIFFATNAAGGMRPELGAGELMMLTDHVSCFVPNPLRGENLDELGTRFPDMTEVYDAGLREILQSAAEKNGIELRRGVYVQLPGPSFETPAEIRMLAALGADAVGMSTVVEAVAARHAGLRVCAVSMIANLAAGLSPAPLSAEEVLAAANAAAPRFKALLWDSIARMKEDE